MHHRHSFNGISGDIHRLLFGCGRHNAGTALRRCAEDSGAAAAGIGADLEGIGCIVGKIRYACAQRSVAVVAHGQARPVSVGRGAALATNLPAFNAGVGGLAPA